MIAIAKLGEIIPNQKKLINELVCPVEDLIAGEVGIWAKEKHAYLSLRIF